MKTHELIEDVMIKEWFSTIGAKPQTQHNYLQALQKYTEYIEMAPDELITQAEDEIINGILPRKRLIKKHLLCFRDSLNEGKLAPKTIQGVMAGVRSFYSSFDIDIPKIEKRRQKTNTLKEHNDIPTKRDILDILNYANARNSAIVLLGATSGLSMNEILHLKVGDFRKGYDPVTEITTFKLRREKVEYDFVTFCSPLTSQAILAYIDHRNRPANYRGKRKIEELTKRQVNGDDDFLFIKNDIAKGYLENPDDNDRKLNRDGFMNVYRLLGRAAGKDSLDQGKWHKIRSHNMRKYFNSTLLNAGADFFMVDFWMGHTLDATRSAYFRADVDAMKVRYIHFLPVLELSDTETKTIETAEFVELKKENEAIKEEMEKMKEIVNRDTSALEEMFNKVGVDGKYLKKVLAAGMQEMKAGTDT